MIKKELFDRICAHAFVPDIDLFASRLNYQVEKFVSWLPQPGAVSYDAFSLSWKDMSPYIFPPFNLISKVINKVIADRVGKAIMIVPHWVSQSWFPLLMSVLISLPIRIPRHKDVVSLPHNGQLHPLGKKLSLVVVIVSGDHSRIKAFQKQLSIPSYHPGGQAQKSNTVWHGRSGVFGVLKGVPIRFVPLK